VDLMGSFIIDQHEAPSAFVLALLYFIVGIYSVYKFRFNRQTCILNVDPQKLLGMSIFLVTVIRLLSFIGITLLQLWDIQYKESSAVLVSSERPFYEKTVLVMFDLPDFIILSCYTLLVLVWVEAFLMSRLHWLSNQRYRRLSLLAYMMFNMVLYAGQVVIYAFLFVPSTDQRLLQEILYVSLTTLNLTVILGYLFLYVFFAIMFAGFPSRSAATTRKLNEITKIACSWTLARVAWALFALTSIVKGWFSESGVSAQVSSIIFVVLFVFTELLPFCGILNFSFYSHANPFEEASEQNESPSQINVPLLSELNSEQK